MSEILAVVDSLIRAATDEGRASVNPQYTPQDIERKVDLALALRDEVRELVAAQADRIRELEWNYAEAMRQYDDAQERACNAEARIRELEALLDCRAGRLLKRHIPFIVVKQAEPYYCEVYGTIRQHELAKGEWTQEDENIYREQCALFGRFESGSEPEAIR